MGFATSAWGTIVGFPLHPHRDIWRSAKTIQAAIEGKIALPVRVGALQ